jgi:hypothetical protein
MPIWRGEQAAHASRTIANNGLRQPSMSAPKIASFAAAIAILVTTTACRERAARTGNSAVKPDVRDTAMRAARVWFKPSVDPASIDFGDNFAEPGAFHAADDVSCEFVLQQPGGTTPKFYCRTSDGRVVKVRYGAVNPEIPAGVAATRLLASLGFAVDRLDKVRSVRCRGCPPFPFEALRCIEGGAPAAGCLEGIDNSKPVRFDRAAIELPVQGRTIESFHNQGWGWFELDRIDPTAGGSSRAEVDALRLMGVLLAHWDNKHANQRLVCRPDDDQPNGGCRAPIAVLHDLGATFGPLKLDLQNWRNAAMWQDAAACRISLKALPFNTQLADHRISEDGRQLALKLLHPLSLQQLETLFATSGVTELDHVMAAAHIPAEWARTFVAKVDAIAAAGPCPTAAQLALLKQ